MSLAWAPSAGATSYNVKRSSSTNELMTVANTASITYNDVNVVNGGTLLYVVTAVNAGGENPTNSNKVSATVPIPPPPAPAIGWFDYEGVPVPITVFHPISGAAYITHNDLSLAIEQVATNGPATYYTDDGSDPSPTNGTTPPVYVNGTSGYVQPLPVTSAPDLTIKAMSVNSGGSSAIVTAEFIYQVGNPSINGNNAAQFTVSDITTNALFLYTMDGSNPLTNANATFIGPVSGTNNSITLSLQFPANTNLMLFQIVGFRANYLTQLHRKPVFFHLQLRGQHHQLRFCLRARFIPFCRIPWTIFYRAGWSKSLVRRSAHLRPAIQRDPHQSCQ